MKYNLITEDNNNFSILKTVIPEMEIDLSDISIIREFSNELHKIRKENHGLGLAANQIGEQTIRMFAIGTDTYQMTCINPIVITV